MRGTTFKPSGNKVRKNLVIPSARYPNKYIKYSSFYGPFHAYKDYNTYDGRKITDNYNGFIYWEYIDNKDYDPNKHIKWICKGKDKGGYFDVVKENSSSNIKDQEDYDDDIAAAVAWAAIAGILYYGAKIGASYFGQWWVWACP